MKVAYVLCGLAILLQAATQADARSAFRNGRAQEAPEGSFASDDSAMTTSESEPFVATKPSGGDGDGFVSASYTTDAADEPATTSNNDYVDGGYLPDGNSYGVLADGDGGEEYTSTKEPPVIDDGDVSGGYPSGLSDDSLPPQGYSGDTVPDYEAPPEIFVAPEMDEPTPYEPSWDDLHPPGWNGPGFPDGYTGGDDYPQIVDTLPAPIDVGEDGERQHYDNQGDDIPPPVLDEPEPDGLDKNSLPPWARDGDAVPDSPPDVDSLQFVTGGSDDSLPPWARDGYAGDDDNYVPDAPPMTGFDSSSLPQQHDDYGQTIVVDPTPEQPTYPQQFVTGGPGVALPPSASYTRPDYDFKPSSSSVPPFWALDADGDDDVTLDEWTASVEELKAVATTKASRAKDAHAKQLLDDIIDFHYANLHACMAQGVQAHVSPSDLPKATRGIESSCYVKFRYSLFAGAAPFEWVARKQPVITGEQISTWFQKQFDVAQTDVASGRIRPESLPAVPYLMKSLSCLDNILEAHHGTMFDSTKYYKLVDATLDCVGIAG
ncbi:hypothetical protein Gpo141_00004997 [Globisporangium polare]